MKKKNILITGGIGFIGHNLITKIQSLNKFNIYVLDKKKKKSKFFKKRIKLIFLDINNISSSKKLKKIKFHFVFHLAALSKPSLAEKKKDLAVKHNITGLKNVLDFVRLNSPKAQIIFPSGGAVYDVNAKYLPMDEKHPTKISQNMYTFTKRIGELICQEYISCYKLNIIILRLFNTFGPFQESSYLVPSLILKAKKNNKLDILNGSIVRDFYSVDNVIELFILILNLKKPTTGGPYNVGSGKPSKITKIGLIISKYFGKKINDKNLKNLHGTKKQYPSLKKIKKELKWSPSINLNQGLARTLKFYK